MIPAFIGSNPVMGEYERFSEHIRIYQDFVKGITTGTPASEKLQRDKREYLNDI